MVDIKTLRVGSHILVNGKRVRVCGIRPVRSPFNVFQVIIQHDASDLSSLGYVPSASNIVEPIPLTEELLMEMGYEQKRMDFPYGKPDIWYVDPESAKLMENELVVPTVSIWPMEKFGFADWWKIRVLVGDRPMYEGEYVCRYLHEAEAFLSLHGVELIKE